MSIQVDDKAKFLKLGNSLGSSNNSFGSSYVDINMTMNGSIFNSQDPNKTSNSDSSDSSDKSLMAKGKELLVETPKKTVTATSDVSTANKGSDEAKQIAATQDSEASKIEGNSNTVGAKLKQGASKIKNFFVQANKAADKAEKLSAERDALVEEQNKSQEEAAATPEATPAEPNTPEATPAATTPTIESAPVASNSVNPFANPESGLLGSNQNNGATLLSAPQVTQADTTAPTPTLTEAAPATETAPASSTDVIDNSSKIDSLNSDINTANKTVKTASNQAKKTANTNKTYSNILFKNATKASNAAKTAEATSNDKKTAAGEIQEVGSNVQMAGGVTTSTGILIGATGYGESVGASLQGYGGYATAAGTAANGAGYAMEGDAKNAINSSSSSISTADSASKVGKKGGDDAKTTLAKADDTKTKTTDATKTAETVDPKKTQKQA